MEREKRGERGGDSKRRLMTEDFYVFNPLRTTTFPFNLRWCADVFRVTADAQIVGNNSSLKLCVPQRAGNGTNRDYCRLAGVEADTRSRARAIN